MLRLKIAFFCFGSCSYSFDCPFGVATMKKQFPVVVSRGFRNNICSKSRPCFRNSVLKVASKNLAHVFGSKISSSPPAKTPEYNVFFTDRSDVVNVSFLSWVN